jgi:hypothetical protein
LASSHTAISNYFLDSLLVCDVATVVCSAYSSALLKLSDDIPLFGAGLRKDIQANGICTRFEDSDSECDSEPAASSTYDDGPVI